MGTEDLLQRARKRGWINEQQALIARSEAEETGDDIGEVLVENRFLTTDQVRELRTVEPPPPVQPKTGVSPWAVAIVGILVLAFVGGLIAVGTRKKSRPSAQVPVRSHPESSKAPPPRHFAVPLIFLEVPDADVVLWFDLRGFVEISTDVWEVKEGAMCLDHNGEMPPLWVQVLKGSFSSEAIREAYRKQGYRSDQIDGRPVLMKKGLAVYVRDNLVIRGTEELVARALSLRGTRDRGYRPSPALRSCIERVPAANLLITIPVQKLAASWRSSRGRWVYEGALRCDQVEDPVRIAALLQEWKLTSLDYEVGHLLQFTMDREPSASRADADYVKRLVEPLEALRP